MSIHPWLRKNGDLAMIKNNKKIEKFERELIRKEKTNIKKNLQLVDAMYREAVEMGVFPLKDPLDGIEVVIKIAKVVNSVQ